MQVVHSLQQWCAVVCHPRGICCEISFLISPPVMVVYHEEIKEPHLPMIMMLQARCYAYAVSHDIVHALQHAVWQSTAMIWWHCGIPTFIIYLYIPTINDGALLVLLFAFLHCIVFCVLSAACGHLIILPKLLGLIMYPNNTLQSLHALHFTS